jgi:hypothetical protein
MKFVALLAVAFALAAPSVAEARGSHSVRGHMRSNGVYVAPHRATNANGTRYDNWSTRGNVNPYTGRVGTRSPY